MGKWNFLALYRHKPHAADVIHAQSITYSPHIKKFHVGLLKLIWKVENKICWNDNASKIMRATVLTKLIQPGNFEFQIKTIFKSYGRRKKSQKQVRGQLPDSCMRLVTSKFGKLVSSLQKNVKRCKIKLIWNNIFAWNSISFLST